MSSCEIILTVVYSVFCFIFAQLKNKEKKKSNTNRLIFYTVYPSPLLITSSWYISILDVPSMCTDCAIPALKL